MLENIFFIIGLLGKWYVSIELLPSPFDEREEGREF
jgi:hypothetical protein